jgi:hypothetical protein
MAINWTAISSTLSGISTALSSAGVSSTSIPSILSAIGLASNPNEAEELTICSQIMMAASNPTLASALAMKLATEAGIPAAAASLATTLAQPGVDIPSRIMQIETIIKNGG